MIFLFLSILRFLDSYREWYIKGRVFWDGFNFGIWEIIIFFKGVYELDGLEDVFFIKE